MCRIFRMNKKFDKDTHQKFDQRGKTVIKQFLSDLNFTDIKENMIESPSTGYFDISALWKIREMYRIDCEIKTNWRYGGKPFPFMTVQIPRRKIEKPSFNQATHFSVISEDEKGIWCCRREYVVTGDQKRLTPKNTNIPEDFIQVDKDKGVFFVLRGNKWEKVQ